VKARCVQRAKTKTKNCDVIKTGLPKVPINEKGEIISKCKDEQ